MATKNDKTEKGGAGKFFLGAALGAAAGAVAGIFASRKAEEKMWKNGRQNR